MKRQGNERDESPIESVNPRTVALTGIMLITSGLSACGSSPTISADTSGNTTALAVGTVGGAVASTSGDPISMLIKHQDSLYADILRSVSPISLAFATSIGECPTAELAHSGTCISPSGNNSMTLVFPSGGCVYGGGTGPIWIGGTVLTTGPGNSAPVCGSYPFINGVGITSLTRTYTGSLLSSPTARTNAPGTVTVDIDTSAPSSSVFVSAESSSAVGGTIGWEYSIPAGGGYERTYVSNSEHELTVTARLIGYSGSSPSGKVEFDHTISTTDVAGTSTPLQLTLAGSGASETQTLNGSLNFQHNLLKMTGSTEFNDVVFDSGCCYPVSGSVTTSFTGGPNNGKKESMTFSDATCALDTMGQVEFTNVNGEVGTMTLTHCL